MQPSQARPLSWLQVRGTILREPLAEVPQFGVMGCSDHVWQCPGHKWRPNITLVEPSLGLNFSMQFMDEADGAACVVVHLLSGGCGICRGHQGQQL